ncbi:hypothetical protein P43SY_005873 [Pythium insidiosum]|uniref:Uncharacterized protein n=1 Tax=Pythium insidiosum TaxID=114742 RepID=A0AAD5LSK8_PYTIN|nr:hypothetical protein P43SY_005873 [Pythium insidiosum]
MAVPAVSSTRFLRFACDHELFQPEYQSYDIPESRSNRRRGTKILRCFPHCCPDHKPRCYCGCSLQVAVTFGDAATASADDIGVYARFEPLDDPSNPPYHSGDVVPVPVRSVTESAAWTEWIQAVRESAIKQAQMPQNTVLYVLNNNRFPRWYYSYDSGAKKTQRAMKHVLKVYIFRLEPSTDQQQRRSDSRVLATVLSSISSTTFTLVSYRRARHSHRDELAAQARVEDFESMSEAEPNDDDEGKSEIQHDDTSLLTMATSDRMALYESLEWWRVTHFSLYVEADLHFHVA